MMTDIQWLVAVIVNAVVLLGAFVTVSIRTTYKLGQIEADIVKLITDHSQDDLREFAKVRDEIDLTGRSFGESVAAVRQKINDVELSSAQLYVRRDGFYKSIDQIIESVAVMRSELRADLLRLEGKIDNRGN